MVLVSPDPPEGVRVPNDDIPAVSEKLLHLIEGFLDGSKLVETVHGPKPLGSHRICKELCKLPAIQGEKRLLLVTILYS